MSRRLRLRRRADERSRQAPHVPHVLVIVENQSVPHDRRVWQQCLTLVEEGLDVTVICPRGTGDSCRPHEKHAGIEIFRYRPSTESDTVGSYLLGYVSSWLRTARLAVSVWRQHRFDLIQACNPPDTYFLLALLFRPFGVRFLFDQHDPSPEVYSARFANPSPLVRRLLAAFEQMTHHTADHVITVNKSLRQLLLARSSAHPDQLTVVRTGPDLQRLRLVPADPALKRGRRYLCSYLGVMGPQDRVDIVVRAAHVLVHEQGRRDIHFALLGFGECLPALQELTRELDVADYTTFTGHADDAVISAYFSSSDVGLQPDPKTEFNDLCTMVKTLEYMTFGLPVVAFDLLETRRSAADAAVYVEKQTPEAFAEAIAALLDAPDECRRRSEIGWARARDELAWERQKATYVAVVRGLCRR